jgi:hypothetical protein
MTIAAVRTALENIIKGIPESDLTATASYGKRFVHEPRLFSGEGESGRNRNFALRCVSATTKAMASGTTSRRTFSDFDIVVDYASEQTDDRLDVVLWTDYAVLREALLSETGWNRPTSTIDNVTQTENALDAVTDDIENGDGVIVGRRLTLRITVMHQG